MRRKLLSLFLSVCMVSGVFFNFGAANAGVITENGTIIEETAHGNITTEGGTTEGDGTTDDNGTTEGGDTDIPINSFELNGTMVTMHMVGVEALLEAEIFPENATDKNLIWTSNNPSIIDVIYDNATVSQYLAENNVIEDDTKDYAILRATGVGTTTILVQTPDGSYSQSCTAEVLFPGDDGDSGGTTEVPMESITITDGQYYQGALQGYIVPGETIELEAVITPENATENTIVWTSTNYGVATVENGVVTGVSPGWANIQASNEAGTVLKYYSVYVIGGTKTLGCGDTLSWSFDNGVLTISGMGAMSDWYYYPENPNNQLPPWYDLKNSIKSIIIEEGVTEVGEFAFCGYRNVESLILPKSIERVDWMSTYDCDNMRAVYYAGDEENWTEVNKWLTEANAIAIARNLIKDYTYGNSKFMFAKKDIYTNELAYHVTLNPYNHGGKVIAALYTENGKLIDSRVVSGEVAQSVIFESAEDNDVVKVMWWDSVETMKPICELQTIQAK